MNNDEKEIKNSLEMNELNDNELEGVAGGALPTPSAARGESRGDDSREKINDIKNSIARLKLKK